MPGVCRSCGEPVHRKTAGGNWFKVCDDCRASEPPEGSFVEEDFGPIAELPMPPMPEPPESDNIELPPMPPDPGDPPRVGYGPGTATGGVGERDSGENKPGLRSDLPPGNAVDLSREPF